jgi:hypothetical protein
LSWQRKSEESKIRVEKFGGIHSPRSKTRPIICEALMTCAVCSRGIPAPKALRTTLMS